jgi:MFS family permease
MSSGMMAAALDEISHDVDMSPSTTLLASSIYFLGLASGPLFIAAWSEMDGRKHIWIFSNFWYILWNSVAPVSNSKALLILGRLLSGVGASAGITVSFLLSRLLAYNEN